MNLSDRARRLGFAELLRAQQGLIRRDQAEVLGFSEIRVSSELRAGRWRRVLPRVYQVGSGGFGPARRILAVWLWAGEDSVIAGSAAAWWLGLHSAFPPRITVLLPPGHWMRGQPLVEVRRMHVDVEDCVTWRGIRVTAPARTCLDLVRQGKSALAEDMLRRKKTTVAGLQASLYRGAGRPGQKLARQLVAGVANNPWSKPERVAHELLTRAGITGWVANVRARGVGRKIFPDIAFEAVKLALEIDGRGSHDGAIDPAAFERDHQRELVLLAGGWTVLRFTVRQVLEEPELFVGMVQTVLHRLRTSAR